MEESRELIKLYGAAKEAIRELDGWQNIDDKFRNGYTEAISCFIQKYLEEL